MSLPKLFMVGCADDTLLKIIAASRIRAVYGGGLDVLQDLVVGHADGPTLLIDIFTIDRTFQARLLLEWVLGPSVALIGSLFLTVKSLEKTGVDFVPETGANLEVEQLRWDEGDTTCRLRCD